MHKTAGMLGLILALLIVFSSSTSAADSPKKYSVEIQLGGGYYLMDDVNNALPNELNIPGVSPDKINIGEQVGVGISYRNLENFGWQFGFNKMAFIGIQKFRVEAVLPGTPTKSWSEQTTSGAEFYALATWYKPMSSFDLMFGIGPAIYWASLDRSIDIINSASGGYHLTTGSFTDAKGKSLGIMGSIGLAIPVGSQTDLVIQAGGRYAKVTQLEYENPSTAQDKIVYKNSGTGSKMTVDFSGGFVKLSIRSYFKPSSDWRSPKR
ncbi:hypothetical protein K9N50_12750 [bacterium]|nr:hypothetical protein [bacterium]